MLFVSDNANDIMTNFWLIVFNVPFIERDLKTKCVVDMEGNQTVLYPANGNLGKGDSR